MRTAAANLEFEEAGRLRDELKRLKLLDLEFARDVIGSASDARDEPTAPAFGAGTAAGVADRKRSGRGRP